MSRERNAGESAICPRGAQPRRSCGSSARNAGKSAICPVSAQPSAEIARVECAKCRRECDLSGARATHCGDRACRVREMQARVRFVRCARNPFAEIVRVECAKRRRECDLSGARATLCGDRACRVREKQARGRLVPRARAYLGSWKMRTGERLVQLEYAEYLGSWKMRTGDSVVQL